MRLQTKEQRAAARQIYIPKGVNTSKVALKDGSAVVYLYSMRDKLLAIGFRGTAARAEFHYSYRTEAQRREYVTQWLASVRALQERKANERSERSEWVNPLKVGDILHTSWGYDQTNVEFYAVTRMSGRRVWVREIAADYEATGFMSGNTWPAMPIRYIGEEMMRLAQPLGKGVRVKITSCADAWPVDARSYGTSSYA
jgi:hypothetical protein